MNNLNLNHPIHAGFFHGDEIAKSYHWILAKQERAYVFMSFFDRFCLSIHPVHSICLEKASMKGDVDYFDCFFGKDCYFIEVETGNEENDYSDTYTLKRVVIGAPPVVILSSKDFDKLKPRISKLIQMKIEVENSKLMMKVDPVKLGLIVKEEIGQAIADILMSR